MSTGRFVWFDLKTTDLAAARAFYGGLFDWDLQAHGAEYVMISVGGGACGGMAAMPAGHPSPSHWIPYVSVDDLAATLDKARAIGGKVLMQHRAPGVGEFAVVADRQGAILSPIQLEHESPRLPTEKTRNYICWSELGTSDPADALAFYVDLFGWKHENHGGYTVLGDEHNAGMADGQPGVPPFWLLYTNVVNADATAAKVTELGGRVLHGPAEMEGVGRFAVLQDPTGAVFAVMQSAARPA
ncbi:MAG: VOC family protein [Pseudomonadota bacterium]|nr:VOC family protein [Pseudomonadota bacterium]